MLLVLFEEDRLTSVVLDDSSNEFIRVPGIPLGPGTESVALAPDGQSLAITTLNDGLCLLTLATGYQQWFQADDWVVRRASISPDGLTIAVVATGIDPTAHGSARDVATIDLIDVPTGRRRRLLSTPGGWSAETSISWSPDGLLVAASYLTIDDEVETVVLDRQGAMQRRSERAFLPASPNGASLSSREFVHFNENMNLMADHLDGSVRPLAPPGADVVVAVADCRLIWLQLWQPNADSVELVTTDLYGNDPQTLVRVRPAAAIVRCDIAYAIPSGTSS